METANTITLEFLRTGGPENQLISSLTPYLAVCENQEPRTVDLPFDHHEYLIRQARLRYEFDEGGERAGWQKVEAELLEMGRKISTLLGNVPGLAASFGSASANGPRGTVDINCTCVVHLELVFSALELSMMPFEAAISPDGCPGQGQPLSLQTELPVTITRRHRSAVNTCVSWRRKPKILLALSRAGREIPELATLTAFRRALEPWTKPVSDHDNIGDLITVLPNASLEAIQRACSEDDFSHIHILAHGGSRRAMGGERYGIVLDSRDGLRREVVSGSDLAAAIRTYCKPIKKQSSPICLSIAACDSGNTSTVIPPGGSVAQELHQAGIPFVVGSQFPLSFEGAIVLVEALYPRLLLGADPRIVMHDVRKRLKLLRDVHDWASVVTYLAESKSMKDELFLQRIEQARGVGKAARAVGSAFAVQGREPPPEVADKFKAALECLEDAAPAVGDKNPYAAGARGEIMGLRAAIFKQQADIARRAGQQREASAKNPADVASIRKAWSKAEVDLLERSRAEYLRGAKIGSFGTVLEDWGNVHWLATQYLALSFFLGAPTEKSWFLLAEASTRADLRENDEKLRAWAYATQAELVLLDALMDEQADLEDTKSRIRSCLRKVFDEVGPAAFHISSTRDQFARYPGWLMTYRPEHRWASEIQAIADETAAVLQGRFIEPAIALYPRPKTPESPPTQ